MKETSLMGSFHRKLAALCVLTAGLAWTPAAQANPLMATGFTVGSQPVTLTSPGFVLGPTVSAGALDLNPPAGVIAYCIDIFQTIHFGIVYYDYTATSLAADLGLTPARKGEIAQLFHGFYDDSLTSATKSAAFQLALWEITFESALSTLNADAASSNKGTTYATGPDGPGTVIAIANSWLGGLDTFSVDLSGFTTYRSSEHQDLIGYEPVPGPATLVIFVAGLGVLGFAVRHRLRP
jgi:hypothetical protein